MEKNNLFKKSRLLKVLLIILLLTVIVGVVVYFSFLKSKVPANFITEFNKINVSLLSIQDEIVSFSGSLNDLESKEKNKDYAGAIVDLKTAIKVLNSASSKNAELKAEVDELKIITDTISDDSVQGLAFEFVDVAEKTNETISMIIDENIQLDSIVENYYENLMKGKYISLDENNISKLSDDSDKNSQVLADLINQWKDSSQSLAKTARFELIPIR